VPGAFEIFERTERVRGALSATGRSAPDVSSDEMLAKTPFVVPAEELVLY
jgi:hypothetical protein